MPRQHSCPRAMIPIRSPRMSASSMLCVVSMMAHLCLTEAMRSHRCRREMGSMPNRTAIIFGFKDHRHIWNQQSRTYLAHHELESIVIIIIINSHRYIDQDVCFEYQELIVKL